MSKRQTTDLANLVGISKKESNTQRVETILLEPRSFSQSQIVFDLPQQGILSDDIALQIQLTTAANMDIPLVAGIGGLFNRCELFFGTTLINSVTEVGHLLQVQSLFKDQDVRDYSEQTYTGGFSGLKAEAGIRGRLQLNAFNTTLLGTTASTGITGLLQTTAGEVNKLSAFRTTGAAGTTPEYCLKLKTLFPILSQIPLPLFALKERLRFVFHLNPDIAGTRVVGVNTAGITAGNIAFVAGNDVVETSCKLSVDLIYYEDMPGTPNPMMRIQDELDKGVSLVYSDYITVLGQIPNFGVGQAPPITQERTMLLGLDHQVVRNLILAFPTQPTSATDYGNPILGNFESCSTPIGTQLQVSINNENIFPSPLNSDAKFYNELSQIYDTPLKINRGLYSAVGQVTTAPGVTQGTITAPGRAFSDTTAIRGKPNESLQYNLQYLGVNLTKNSNANYAGNGIQIGRQPVQIQVTKERGGTNDVSGGVGAYIWKSYRMICFAECERLMTIRAGNIFISGS